MKDTGKRCLLFHEIGTSHAEVLTDGYEYMGQNIRITGSKTIASGLTFTTTAAKDGYRSVNGVSALYNYNDASLDFKLNKSSWPGNPNAFFSGNLTLTKEFLPSTTAKAVLTFPNDISSEVSLWFRQQYATLSMAALLHPFPGITLSATTGTPSIIIGLEMEVKKIFRRWRQHWIAAMQATRPTWDAYLLLEEHRFVASYVHYLDRTKKISAGATMSRRFSTDDPMDFSAGVSWVIDHLTTVKARIASHGMAETLVQHKLNDKTCLTISGEFDINNFSKKPGIGLAVALEL